MGRNPPFIGVKNWSYDRIKDIFLLSFLLYRAYIKYCVFPRLLESLPPLPRQQSAAIGCTKNYKLIG